MIGVVGGGLAGLAAAYRLQERGHEVRVFEAGDDLGGLAATYETAGDPVERFYHHLSKSEETIVDLAHDLGVGDRLEWRIGKNAYYVDGVVHPLDAPWEIAAFPPLSIYDTLRLSLLTMGVDVRGFPRRLPRFGGYDDLSSFDDVSAESFLREHATDHVYERFWEPLLEAKFGSRAADVSAAWLLGRIRFRGERDPLRGEVLGYVRGSVGALTDALVERVGRENVVTGARVTDLGIEGGAVRSLSVEARERGTNAAGDRRSDEPRSGRESVEAADGGTETYPIDAAVVATMPNVLGELTGYECDIDFQGTICSVFSAETSLTDTYWLNVADDAPFGVFLEHTNFVPPGRYGGEHLYYLASYVQEYDEAPWTLSDSTIERRWLDGVSDLFPEFDRNDLNWIETARAPRTAPIYERGYRDDIVPYDLSEAVARGVYYAGMASEAQYPERSLNGAVEAGFECADRIAAASAPADRNRN